MATTLFERQGEEVGLSKQETAQAKSQGIGVGDFAASKQTQEERQESIANIATQDFGFDGLDGAENPFALDPQILQDVKDQTTEVLGTITEAMGQVSDLAGEQAVDTGALVGRLEESFDTTKNLILNSAMASAAKASFELESFLGSTGSDARSAVRRGMSAQVTNNILNSTQQNIAALYSGHVNSVIDTTLRGAEVNSQVKIAAAKALGDLGSQAGQLILGTNSAILSSYAQNMDYAVALINAQTQRLQLASSERIEQARLAQGFEEIDLKLDIANLNAETSRVTSPVWQAALRKSETSSRNVPGVFRGQSFRRQTGASTTGKLPSGSFKGTFRQV